MSLKPPTFVGAERWSAAGLQRRRVLEVEQLIEDHEVDLGAELGELHGLGALHQLPARRVLGGEPLAVRREGRAAAAEHDERVLAVACADLEHERAVVDLHRTVEARVVNAGDHPAAGKELDRAIPVLVREVDACVCECHAITVRIARRAAYRANALR